MKEIIKKLTETYGPSGREAGIRDTIKREIEGMGILGGKGVSLRVDALGNLIVSTKGKAGGRKVMLAAHMDEIGVVVTHIDEKGFLRFGNVGGVRPLNLSGSRVRFENGAAGIIGLEKLEDPSKVPALEKFYIDVGARDRGDAPVKVGDVACFERPCESVGSRLVAKALDDRIGCAVLLEVLRELGRESGGGSPHDLAFVFTVQEEVGLRGATTSAYGVEPEIAVAVDVTLTGDTPESAPMAVSLGAGPAVKVKDGGMLAHLGVKDWLVRTAESLSIPFQLEVLLGGTTDAMAMQTSRAGVPAGCLSIPTRYTHSPSEMMDYGDAMGAVKLLKSALSGPIELG